MEDIILGTMIYWLPLSGFLICTICDKLIKNYREKHKCKHKNTYWKKKENNSMFDCISGDTMICICKDCGEVVAESFWEFEGMGYK